MLTGRILQHSSRNALARLSVVRPPLSSFQQFTSLAQPFRAKSTTPIAATSWSQFPDRLRRLYSSEASSEAVKSDTATTSNADAAEATDVQTLKQRLEAKEKELIAMKDNYLRSIADYRNLQDRTRRETQNARNFALNSLTKDILFSLDNIEHALAHLPKSISSSPSSSSSSPSSSSSAAAPPPADAGTTVESVLNDLRTFHEGVVLVERSLLDTLAKHGLSRFDPATAKEKFDPLKHNAVFTAPMEGLDDGVVFHTQQKGFELNGRVIRAAQVGVVKNP